MRIASQIFPIKFHHRQIQGQWLNEAILRQTEDRHVAMYRQSQQTPQIVIDNFYVWSPQILLTAITPECFSLI